MKTYKGFPIYNVGTRVRIVDKRKDDGANVYQNVEMINLAGQIVTISEVQLHSPGGRALSSPRYTVYENQWSWDNSLLEGLAFEIQKDNEEELGDPCMSGYLSNFAVKV